ncbi:hypothetical protein QBC37DRAFT_26378 [Rhypophila decipiens]|uniref:protein-tyrosine-phosphatase n=1 Tax=Rhypophila decipiens TaxID=261697 RepID=A0AAN6YH62_9PEZI|nr:hypothetical protein QBC37DRAFT_26378 [Rhypophila decipiens]
MPSATVRRLYEDQIPSFMSVYDLDSDIMDQQSLVTVVDPKLMMGMGPAKQPQDSQPVLRPGALPSDSTHKHNDSTSTQATESAESSPTTTVSCTDSSDLSDPSPSSSPDSPVNLLPLQTFAPTPSFGGLAGMASLSLSDVTLERPMTSPAPRRPKNMKGLSIQPPFNSLSSSLMSEPSSPSFIKPAIPAMRRKPSQLSLKTTTSDLASRPTLEVPASPSVPILQRRALKHSTSSPHMLSGLKSATFGPVGGMTIPTVLERNEGGLSEFFRPSRPPAAPAMSSTIVEEDSPIRPQVANRAHFDYEDIHEVENNEDQKTPGYPDGPICIYDPDVYLYLEPTAEEAAKFDLVINVAREVSNPFEILKRSKDSYSPTKGKQADDSPIPDTAVTTASFATAFEYFPEDGAADTPTTPKASTFNEPEYIHMPWDHNTDISPDLMDLCERIEKKTKEGKKVLVHCQQGASRSASLIIAYGMYRNPALSVNDAYHAAQARSRWISPNMRLMYCLQDFQKEVSKRRMPTSGIKTRPGKSPTKHRMTLSADNIDISPIKAPLTAPLPREDSSTKNPTPERSPVRARGNSTPNSGDPISPGPSSAPSSFSWAEKEDENDRGKFGRFNLNLGSKPSSLHPDSGFASLSSLSRPPPSPGLVPPSLDLPPMSPGFAPVMTLPMTLPKPPPSPGFGAHRFGASSPGGFGFVPLHLGTSPSQSFQKDEGSNTQGLAPLSLSAPPKKKMEKPKVVPERHVIVPLRTFPDDAALLSPRAEVMTKNPLHDPFAGLAGMQFVEVPPTPSDGLFSPRESMFPRDPFYPFSRPTQVEDPRSPPTTGETPIVRSIDEMI